MSVYLPSYHTFLKGTAVSVVGLATLFAGLLYFGQNYIIYLPSFPAGARTVVDNPAKYGLSYEEITLHTIDHIKIKCYLLMTDVDADGKSGTSSDDFFKETARIARPTVIMFHGNAGNIGHRIPIASAFLKRLRCNVLMVSYRGYGLSEGSPSEKGFRIDAQTALDYVTSHPILGCPTKDGDGPTPKIIIYGQSIGGAVALDLAARNPQIVTALILENTFLSMHHMIPAAIPFLAPFSFLCHQRWDNITAIQKLPSNMALLMLSGLQDEIVPSSHMKGLWEIAQKTGHRLATWIDFPNGMHNDTVVQPGYWDAIQTFYDKIVEM